MKRTVVLVALVAAFLWVAPASAAVCAEHKKFTDFLSKKYKEQVRATGLVSNTLMMEVYVFEQGTWSILMTTPNGVTCLIAAGDGFEQLKPEPVSSPS